MSPFRALILLPAFLLGGCCMRPWDAQPMDTVPDEQCRVGPATHGYDLYSWECVDGEHVVVVFYSSEMTCGQPWKETAPCGELTETEAGFVDEMGENCELPPDSLIWE